MPNLTLTDTTALLADFQWLADPPAPSLPPVDKAKWQQAEQDARAEIARRLALQLKIKSLCLDDHPTARQGNHGDGGGSHAPQVGASRPVDRGQVLNRYRQLDPKYARAEAEAQHAARKRLDLLLVSVKTPLLRWSELTASIGAVAAWSTYHTATHKSDSHCLSATIQDLERIKAKMERQSRPVENAAPGPAEAQPKANSDTAGSEMRRVKRAKDELEAAVRGYFRKHLREYKELAKAHINTGSSKTMRAFWAIFGPTKIGPKIGYSASAVCESEAYGRHTEGIRRRNRPQAYLEHRSDGDESCSVLDRLEAGEGTQQ